MRITRRNPCTGEVISRNINVTLAQLEDWNNGTYIQVAMPHLTPSEREFIMTGMTDEDFDKLREGDDECD